HNHCRKYNLTTQAKIPCPTVTYARLGDPGNRGSTERRYVVLYARIGDPGNRRSTERRSVVLYARLGDPGNTRSTERRSVVRYARISDLPDHVGQGGGMCKDNHPISSLFQL